MILKSKVPKFFVMSYSASDGADDVDVVRYEELFYFVAKNISFRCRSRRLVASRRLSLEREIFSYSIDDVAVSSISSENVSNAFP